MKLTYETGTATLIQFIVLSLLNIAATITSVVTTCHHQGASCVGNLLSSIVFYILIVVWFGMITVLGFAAQQKRSRRLAQVLIAAEALIGLVALFNLKLGLRYHNGYLSLFTSAADLLLAGWIISLAFRLMKAGGGRVVTGRARRRPKPRAR
jgi:hypothetical protein